MTTNAFAQTNTERLSEVVDNTRSANTMLASIQDLLTSLVSDVMEAIAALAGNVEALSDMVSDEFDAVDDAISHVDEEVAALDSKVMMLDSTLMDISTQVSSVGDQVAAFDQRDGQMDQYYKDNIDNFAVILPAIKETVDALAASESGASLESISEGIRANSASINEITSSLKMISDQLGTIQEELDIVANTTATSAQATRAPLTGPDEGDLSLKISPYDIAKNVNDDGDMAKVTYTFMCEEDIFLDTLDRVRATDDNKLLSGLSGTDGEEDLVTVTVSGAVSGALYNSLFSGVGDEAGILDKKLEAKNTPLLANNALRIMLTASEAALINTVDFNGADSIYPKADNATHAQATEHEITNIAQLAGNLTNDLHTEAETSDAGAAQTSMTRISAQTLMPTIYELKVSWISDAKDPKCEFMRTGATTDTSTATTVLAPTDKSNVLNEAMKTLDCNSVDTTIVSINPIMSGSLKEATTLEFAIGDDDAPSAVFMFDVNGTHSLKAGYEDALPLDIGTEDLMIKAELSKLTTLLLQVEYQSADGNKCSAN